MRWCIVDKQIALIVVASFVFLKTYVKFKGRT